MAARKNTGRRGNGEGSVFQRRDGIWRGQLMVGYTADGRPDRRIVYGKSKAEVQAKVRELAQRKEEGLLSDQPAENVTVSVFLTNWLETIRTTVRPRTWKPYSIYVRLHLIPALGRTKLAALRPDAIQRLHAAKLQSGLSPRTVHHIRRILHTALNQAVRWGYITRNPATLVDPPAVPRKEMRFLTPEEVIRLLDTAWTSNDRFAPLWTVAVYSGCREGELLGLKWEDVDFSRGTLRVQRNLVAAPMGEPVFGAPKTNRSRRTLTLPDEALEALRFQRAKQDEDRNKLGQQYVDHDLVFATHWGTPLQARNVIRAFKAALERAGLPRMVRVHDLRHTAATLMLDAGVHPKVASERLGHSTVGITLDLYTHSVQRLDQDAANQMQRILRGESGQVSTDSTERTLGDTPEDDPLSANGSPD